MPFLSSVTSGNPRSAAEREGDASPEASPAAPATTPPKPIRDDERRIYTQLDMSADKSVAADQDQKLLQIKDLKKSLHSKQVAVIEAKKDSDTIITAMKKAIGSPE